MNVEPYLFFEGRCEEALEFYKQALNAEVTMLMRYRESPEPPPPGMLPPGSENRIMHASMNIGGATVMASDGSCSGKPAFQGFFVSLGLRSEADARRFYDGLSAGGKVEMPLTKTFWSPCFGMLRDRFGVGWMINVLA